MGNLRIRFKKVTAFLLLVVLAVSLMGIGKVPVASAAANTNTITVKTMKKGLKVTSGNYVYKVNLVSEKKRTVSVVGLTAKSKKKLKKVVIPKSIKIKSKSGKNKGTYSYKVTSVAKNAFKGNKRITKVIVGDNITSIGENAFSGCTNLKTVTLGKSVKTIGESAFAKDNNVTTVVIPKNSKLEAIGKSAFKGCKKLKNINFDNAKKLKKIDDSAFEDTAVDKDKIIGKAPVAGEATKTITVKTMKKGLKVTSGNYVYKVNLVSKKKSTVSVVGLTAKAKKKLKKVVIPKSVKIRSKSGKNKGTYSYKVTSVAKKAFKGNKRITKVIVGDNVTSIGKYAFLGCTNLKTVTLGKSVKAIGESAFAKDNNVTTVAIPKNSRLETIDKNAFKGCKKLKNINLDNAKKLKKIDDSAFEDTAVDKDKLDKTKENIEVQKYSYEVIPLMAPFNSYFYIKTNNPDPDSFRFVDEETKYADKGETGSITPTDTFFSDVKYENSETKRVKGGYIATGSATDGGKLRLQIGKVTGTYPLYNLTTGETTMKKDYEYRDTTVTVQVAELKNVVDYLISTYGDNSKSYFDNLSGIESGFNSECLYSGVYVLGEQKKSTSAPYYGLSTSPHVDQIFYIQSPYYRADSKAMLISALYPMKYDSIGFPSVMMSIAKELDSTATVKWSSSAHYLVDVTYNGETRSYGGAGSGGGQGINANQIKYWYSFDGSNADACMKLNLKDVSAMIQEYGAMEVPEEPTDLPKLTWESVRQTVGKEGSYVKLTLLTSIFGGSADGYTFMYDDGSTYEGPQGWGAVGHFSNAWYDGRYFNRWEYYYPGAKFEETVETESPTIIMKDVTLKLPDDGKTYYYNYNTMDEVSQYNTETGVWSGFMTYFYDSESQTWKAYILNDIMYMEDYTYKSIEDQNFIDACTITMDEALAMNLDANTNKEPESYYIYDRVTSPGTYHSAGN